MKVKITAALLACFMLLASLAACGNNKDKPGDDTSNSSNIPVLPPDTSTTKSPPNPSGPEDTTVPPSDTTTTPPVTTTTEPPVTTTTEPPVTTTPDPVDVTFTACDETVYVIADALNLRTSPAMGNNIYNQVSKGTTLRRVGYHEVWSKVILEDKEYYVSSKYVSPENPNAEVSFTTRYETVYITAAYLNIRENPSTTAPIYQTVTKGTEVIRIGYSEDWSKIMYDGKILYAGSKYLSTEKPNVTPPATTTPTTTTNNP